MNLKKSTIDISTASILRFLLLVVFLVLLYRLAKIVGILLTSVVIASAVEPAAHWLSRYKIPRVLGVLFIYLSTFSLLGLIFYLAAPPLLAELSGFISELPRYLEKNFEPKNIFSFIPSLPTGFSDIFRDSIRVLEEPFTTTAAGFFGAVAAIFGGALSLILIIVISFYLSVQEHGIENFLRIVTPKEYEGYILDLWSRSRRKIGWWLQGQFLLGVLVGVLVFLGLTILGVRYALLLAILSAIFEVIPVFGPVMAAIPAVGIAFIQKPVLGLAVLILYFIVQQFENHLIYPLVVQKTIGIPPLLVVLSLVIGATLAGFFGLFLAVPVATVLVELVNDIARKKEIKL
jgi:predicted PurR-regulated permease PerM